MRIEEYRFGTIRRPLIIGTGAYGSLPVMEEVKDEASKRHVELQIVTTREAVRDRRANLSS